MTDPSAGVPVTRPDFVPARHDVVVALEGWMVAQGLITPSTPPREWTVSNYRDAHLVTAASDVASGRAYLVHRGRVIGFSPSWTSFDSAYDTLMSPARQSCTRHP